MINTLYASLDEPGRAREFLVDCLTEYRTEQGEAGELLVYPKSVFAPPVACRVKIRGKDESADAFSGGLFDLFSKAAFKSADFKEELLAQIWCSNAIFRFEADGYTQQNRHILDAETTLARRFGAFGYNDSEVLAYAFLNGRLHSFYCGVIYALGGTVGSGSDSNALLRISELEYRKRCPGGEFAVALQRQRRRSARLVAVPLDVLLRHYFNDGQYDLILETARSLPAAERTCATAASEALAWYGRSYFHPNAAEQRRKAVETLLAVRADGEDNSWWNYAMGYVRFIFDPALSAKHYRRAQELGENVEPSLVGSRLDQAERDASYAERRAVKKSRRSGEPFAGFDFGNFWDDGEYALKNYVFEPPTDERIADVEMQLGYKLPASYIWLMKQHNGGAPKKSFHRTNAPTTWSNQGAEISGFYAIGQDGNYTLCGGLGSRFMIEDWAYPDIGVYIGHTPTAGHDMIALDYRHCGPEGEPEVVHVGQEDYFKITYLAGDFESYVRGLENAPDENEEDGEDDQDEAQAKGNRPVTS